MDRFSDSKPIRRRSGFAYEVWQPEYPYQVAREPLPSYYGPDFKKGPAQEEVFNRRALGENSLKGHPELRNRAHSFHHPRQEHVYSNPFMKQPTPYPPQMNKDYLYYKGLSDEVGVSENAAIAAVSAISIGRKNTPTISQGSQIQAGIDMGAAGVIRINKQYTP
jgi:hypothetical protein